MNIYRLIKNNINNIIEKTENSNTKKNIIYKFNEKEYIKLNFKGEGTYGIIFHIINHTNYVDDIKKGSSLILKVLKVKCDELEKCKKLKNRMNLLKPNSIKEILVNKYCTKIIKIKKTSNFDLIFFEYIEGYDLKEYLLNKKLNEKELNIIYLKLLISIKVFHKILGFSHRDLKLKNFIFDIKNNTIKLIDYGFICDRKDVNCYNKYQGTAHYIHPYMNKKYARNNLSKKNNNSENKSFSNNNIKSKKVKKFPDCISQDLFSTIIIFLKIIFIHYHKNNIRNNLYKVIKIFNESSKREFRYSNKKKLISRLLKINKNYDNNVINLIINLLNNYWDINKSQFNINSVSNENISEYIFDSLIYSLIIFTDKFDKKEYLINEWRSLLKIL